MVPVINENDTTTTDEISFGDNDFLAAQVAILIGADRLVLLTDIGRPLHRRPAQRPVAPSWSRRSSDLEALEALRHRRVHLAARLRRDALEGRGGRDGHRGRDPGDDRERDRARRVAARRSPASRSGTRFEPQRGRVSSFKLWLRYAKPARGRVTVDDGAERALRERGTSLLPVGVVEVEGDFEAGDAVEVRCDGRPVGKGIVDYSAGELRRIKGMKTDEVRELLPRATEEAVHRDYFVLD